MANFTPVAASIGGALIGLSAGLLILLNGRIAGISGRFGGCLGFGIADKAWRCAFIAGLILAPLTASWVGYCHIVAADADKLGRHHCGWSGGRFRQPAWWRLHLGSRHLRNCTALRPFYSGHHHIYFHGHM